MLSNPTFVEDPYVHNFYVHDISINQNLLTICCTFLLDLKILLGILEVGNIGPIGFYQSIVYQRRVLFKKVYKHELILHILEALKMQ